MSPGKSITDAAVAANVSRRAATYWMLPGSPVRLEYEKQRLLIKQEFAIQATNLHNLALKALEEALSPEAPAGIRFQVAKFIYEAHLQQICHVQNYPSRASW